MTRRTGFALVASLGLLLALALLALGMLGAGSRQALIALEMERARRLRLAAESAARSFAAGWSTADFASLPVGAQLDPGPPESDPSSPGSPPPDPLLTLRLERAGPTLFLLRVEATEGPPGSAFVGRAALSIRTLDPEALRAQFPAAAVVGTAVLEAGEVSATEGCPGDPGPNPGIRTAGEVLHSPTAILRGEPAVDRAEVPGRPPPDPLSEPLLTRLADRLQGSGVITPAPSAEGGACTEEPQNWGSVTPGHPCHERKPLVRAAGPLEVAGGEGRGILVVDGDLTLTGPFRFNGLIDVSGHLRVTGDAFVRGAVRAGELYLVNGRIHHDPCEIRAAASAPALDRAFRPPSGWWIPAW